MSRKPGRSQEESSKLRKELKRLKVEIDQLKKASKNIYILTGNDKPKLVLNIQENLKHSIYSPHQVQRSKSPINSKSKKIPKDPTERNIKNPILPENKENCSTSRTEFLSPHFADNNESIKQDSDELKLSGSFNSKLLKENQQYVNKTIEKLQNENNMLKMLNNLKIENERLRSQIQLGKNESRKEKLNKKHSKNKVSFIDLNESNQAKHPEEKISMFNNINLSQKSQKILKNSRRRSTNQIDPTFISIKFRSPSEIVKSPKDQLSNLFLFPESATHQKKHSSLLSSSFSKSITKSPTSISIGNLDISITPRGQSCKNCDYLLFKGRPTKSCSEHNYK